MNRRDFLSDTMLASAAITVAPYVASLSERPLHLKSLKIGMIKDGNSILEKFQLVKDLGFDGVELNSPSDLKPREVLDAMNKTGIKIPGLVNSLHWSNPLSDPDRAVRKMCRESMVKAFDECAEYGGTTVLLVPAVVNDKVSYQDAWDRSSEEIAKIIPSAEKAGVQIAVENVWNNFLLSPIEAARYIDQFNSSAIGWYMDIGNIIKYGWPEQWINILGKRIIKVDIKDYSREKANNEGVWKGFEVKLGEGSVDWSLVNEALGNVGYSGWGSAEVSGGNRSRLKEIALRMDELYAA